MRTAGILLPVFSLPGEYGIGSFSKKAYEFVDFLKESGHHIWQILPLGATGYGDSPYQTFGTFAGNPYFISLERLIEQKLLTRKECGRFNFGKDSTTIDYSLLYKNRFKALRKAFSRSSHQNTPEYRKFEEDNESWLNDYALFMALKEEFNGKSYTEWPEDIRIRKKEAMDSCTEKLSEEIDFQKYLQYEFCNQWYDLKQYANKAGIRIIGDLPIYVSPDSADVWASPELFELDSSGVPTAVAGCPPDKFTEDGQLWGNPLYRWSYHAETGYSWWISRVRKCRELYDIIRIDHFRGFDQFYSIPYGDKNARGGEWLDGPGYDLFSAIRKSLGKIDVIAEDLGFITPSVRRLVKRTGFPNMKVLEFAFDPKDATGSNDYLPHNYGTNCVVYTGTHDNETLMGWLKGLSPAGRRRIYEYLDLKNRKADAVCSALIRTAYASVADYCIIPLQDHLGLGNQARINTPSTLGGNWTWRLTEDELTGELAEKLLRLVNLYGRG